MTTAGEGSVHVERTGEGPPLVLLHGWAMHGGLFDPLRPALARTHRVHAVDLPGHGRSAPAAPYTLERVVEALDDALAGEPGPLSVVGWSLGGVVAMAWALARPSRIGRLALVCTTPRFVAADGWPHAMPAETLSRFADELRVAWRLTLQRFLALQVHGSMEGRSLLAELKESLFAHGEPSPVVLGEALAVLAGTDLRDRVGSIDIPAWIATGERDTLTPPAAGEWLAATLPRAQHVAFAGAGHVPFLSHRDAFLAELSAFLDASPDLEQRAVRRAGRA